jgi:predicted RNase H-like HicB family nuclease
MKTKLAILIVLIFIGCSDPYIKPIQEWTTNDVQVVSDGEVFAWQDPTGYITFNRYKTYEAARKAADEWIVFMKKDEIEQQRKANMKPFTPVRR